MAKPANPPHTAVIARPRTGSSTRMATSAPATAPKKEAAHARKGVSSHPKMRNSRRTQRIDSGSAVCDTRGDGGENQGGQESHREGGQCPTGARESEQDGESSDDQRQGKGRDQSIHRTGTAFPV